MATDSLVERVAQDLRRRISNREFRVGSRLPSRRRLAEHYQVALLTAHKAVLRLVEDGTLSAADRRTPQVARIPSPSPIPARPAQVEAGRIALITLTTARATSLDAIGHERAERILLPIELAAAQGGSRCRFINLNRLRDDGSHERRTVADGLAEAVAWGASSAAIIDPYGDPQLRSELPTIAACSLRLVYAAAGVSALPMPIPQVLISGDDIGWTAATHLLQAGYEEIIAWQPFQAPWFPERIAKARSACAAAGRPGAVKSVDGDGPVCWHSEQQVAETRRQLPALLARGGPLRQGRARRAVLAPNDLIALLLIDALRAAGLEPGRDIGVIGTDDHAGAMGAGLTTLRPPLDALGAATGRLLCQHGDETVILQHQLIPRSSTDPQPSEPA